MAGRPKKRHEVVQPLDKPYRYIPLTREQNAIVDAGDFEWLSQWNWHAVWNDCTKSFYATRTVEHNKAIKMHRQILGLQNPKIEGDHINGDTLDNRRENLRKATRRQNIYNSRKQNMTGLINCVRAFGRGKYYDRWRSRISINGKRVHLGYFRSPEEAARAHDEAAKKHRKEFAVLNFS